MAQVSVCFFCEDIRPEEGGKISAMGLMGHQYVFNRSEEPPFLRSLSFYAYVRNPERVAHPFSIAIEGAPFEKPLQVRGTLPVEADKTANHIFVSITQPRVVGAGTLTGTLTVETDPPAVGRAELDILFK
jgi:hypothetical protein